MQSIAHRDIKPANILVSANGTYKLSDFGAAAMKLFEEAANTLIGTPAYFSPELLRSYDNYKERGIVDSRYHPFASDVFSFGATIMSLALLRPCHSRELINSQEIIDTIPYSEGMRHLLRQMLSPESANRPTIWFVHGMAQALQYSADDPLAELFEVIPMHCVLCGNMVRNNGMARSLPCCGKGWVCSEVCRMIYGKEGVTCRFCHRSHIYT